MVVELLHPDHRENSDREPRHHAEPSPDCRTETSVQQRLQAVAPQDGEQQVDGDQRPAPGVEVRPRK